MPVPHNASLDIAAFRIGISQSRVDDMIRLVRLSRLPPQTYEGSDPAFGITWKWMAEAKHHWERFDWYSGPLHECINTNTPIGDGMRRS